MLGTPTRDRVLEGALLVFAATVPWSIFLAQVSLGLFVLVWLAGRFAGVDGLERRPGLAELGIAALVLGEVIACLVNRVPGQMRAIVDDHVFLLAIPPLAAVAGARPIFYRKALIIAATMGAVVACYAIWQHFNGLDLVRSRPLEAHGGVFVALGAFPHHLTYGGSVMLAFLATLGLASAGRRWRLLPALLVPFLCLGLAWSYARSAWLGAAAGLGILAVVGGPVAIKRRLLVLILCVAALAGLVTLDASVRRHGVRTLALFEDPPPRVRIWQTTIAMLREHPLGVAPGRFEALFPLYQVPGIYVSRTHAHADLLRAWTDGGPLGMFGYLLLVPGSAVTAIVALQRAGRRRDDQDHTGEAARIDLLAIAAAGATGFAVAGLLQTYFWDLEDMLFLLLLIAPAAAAVPSAAHARSQAASP